MIVTVTIMLRYAKLVTRLLLFCCSSVEDQGPSIGMTHAISVSAAEVPAWQLWDMLWQVL